MTESIWAQYASNVEQYQNPMIHAKDKDNGLSTPHFLIRRSKNYDHERFTELKKVTFIRTDGLPLHQIDLMIDPIMMEQGQGT